jgi:1,4-dihydroxy-2-naphthoyl-CoA synthase
VSSGDVVAKTIISMSEARRDAVSRAAKEAFTAFFEKRKPDFSRFA